MRNPGAKQDPNLSTALVYKLITDETESDLWRRIEEYKTKVVPIAKDNRPEAKALFHELNPALNSAARPSNCHVLFMCLPR